MAKKAAIVNAKCSVCSKAMGTGEKRKKTAEDSF